MIKNLPANAGDVVQSLGQEDPLKEVMATHSSILARRIPWTEEPGGLQSMGLQRVRHDWATNIFTLPYLSLTKTKESEGQRYTYIRRKGIWDLVIII